MFCPNRRGMGHGVNGAFARYAVVRQDQAYKIPEGFDMAESAVSEPFAAAVQAVEELTQVRLGDIALVSGPGPIGLLCLKLPAAVGIALGGKVLGKDFRTYVMLGDGSTSTIMAVEPVDAKWRAFG